MLTGNVASAGSPETQLSASSAADQAAEVERSRDELSKYLAVSRFRADFTNKIQIQ